MADEERRSLTNALVHYDYQADSGEDDLEHQETEVSSLASFSSIAELLKHSVPQTDTSSGRYSPPPYINHWEANHLHIPGVREYCWRRAYLHEANQSPEPLLTPRASTTNLAHRLPVPRPRRLSRAATKLGGILRSISVRTVTQASRTLKKPTTTLTRSVSHSGGLSGQTPDVERRKQVRRGQIITPVTSDAAGEVIFEYTSRRTNPENSFEVTRQVVQYCSIARTHTLRRKPAFMDLKKVQVAPPSSTAQGFADRTDHEKSVNDAQAQARAAARASRIRSMDRLPTLLYNKVVNDNTVPALVAGQAVDQGQELAPDASTNALENIARQLAAGPQPVVLSQAQQQLVDTVKRETGEDLRFF